MNTEIRFRRNAAERKLEEDRGELTLIDGDVFTMRAQGDDSSYGILVYHQLTMGNAALISTRIFNSERVYSLVCVNSDINEILVDSQENIERVLFETPGIVVNKFHSIYTANSGLERFGELVWNRSYIDG